MQSLFTINCNDYPIRVCGILDVRWCEAVPRAGLANNEQKGTRQWVLLKLQQKESAETLNELRRLSLCLTKNPFNSKGSLTVTFVILKKNNR